MLARDFIDVLGSLQLHRRTMDVARGPPLKGALARGRRGSRMWRRIGVANESLL